MPSRFRLKYAHGCFEYVELIQANELAVAPLAGRVRSTTVTDAPRFASRYARFAPMMPPPAMTMRSRPAAAATRGIPATATPANKPRNERRGKRWLIDA